MYPGDIAVLLLLWASLAFIVVTGAAAAFGKNRNPIGWMFLAAVLTPAGALILLAFLPKLPPRTGLLHAIRTAGIR